MKMSQSFKLIILLAVASLALSAPTGNVENAKETLVVKDTEVKTDVNDKDSIAVVPNEKIVYDKMENTKKEASAIVEVKDKVQFIEPVDKKEETKENIETVSEVKDVADKNELSDEKNSVVKSDVLETKTPEKKEEKVEITPTDMKTVLKMADEVIKKTDKLVVDVKESIKYSDDPLKEVDSKLRDVASAVAEAVTNLPLPGKPERPENNKFTQVFGMFVNELMTVPMVILHAISNAISSLTGGTKPIAVAAASS